MDQSNTTLLLVEDNEDDVFMMERALKKANIANTLRIVTDGQQALDYFSGAGEFCDRQRFPLPSVVFLDLKIPYVSGFEVLEWLRQQPQLSSMFVVVLTSSAENRDQEKAYALGARSYLVKPPAPESLRELLKSLENRSFPIR